MSEFGAAPPAGAEPIQGQGPEPPSPGLPSNVRSYLDFADHRYEAMSLASREVELRKSLLKKRNAETEKHLKHLLGDEWALLARQQVEAESMGLDSQQVWGGTEILNPELVDMRWLTTQSERMSLMEARMLQPEMREKVANLQAEYQKLLIRFEVGSHGAMQVLQESKDPEERRRLMKHIFPQVNKAEHEKWKAQILEIDKAIKETGSGFNVWTHPDTKTFARGLTATVMGDNPGGFIMPKGELREGKWTDPFVQAVDTGVKGSIGAALNITQKTLQWGANALNWIGLMSRVEVPDFPTALSYTLDENGKPVATGEAFGLAEMAASMMGYFMDEESKAYMAASLRSEIDAMDDASDLTLQGILNSAGAATGAIMGFNKFMLGPGMKAGYAFEQGMAKGIAYLRTGTKAANAIKKTLGLVAGSATLSLQMGAATGRYENFGEAAMTGLVMMPAIRLIGAMGDKFEGWLHGGQMPGALWEYGARSIRNGFEGLGLGTLGATTGVMLDPMFGVDTPEGLLMQDFFKDPNPKTFGKVAGYISQWIVGNMLVGGFMGRAGTVEALAKSRAKRQTQREFTDEALFGKPSVQKAFKESLQKQIEYRGYEEKAQAGRAEVYAAIESGEVVDEAKLALYGPLIKEEAIKPLREMGRILRTEAKVIHEAEKAGFMYQPIKAALEAHRATMHVEGGKVVLNVDENLMTKLVRHQLRTAATTKGRTGQRELGALVYPAGEGRWNVVATRGRKREVPGEARAEIRERVPSGVRLHEVADLHVHPTGSPFSMPDLEVANMERWHAELPAGEDYAPNIVVTAEGGFVVKPKQGRTPKELTGNVGGKTLSLMTDLIVKAEQGQLGSQLQKYIHTRYPGKQAGWVSELSRITNLVQTGGQVPTGDRPMVNLYRQARHLAMEQFAKENELEYAFFTPVTLGEKWANFMETKKFDMSGGEDFLIAAGMVGGRIEAKLAQERREAERAEAEKRFEEGLPPELRRPRAQEEAQEDTINQELADAGRSDAKMRDQGDEPPDTAAGLEALTKWFDQQSTYWGVAKTFGQYAKDATSAVWTNTKRYFTDPKFRADLAKRIRAIGYGQKFLSLGVDEQMVKARADELHATLQRAEKWSRIKRNRMFRAILDDPKLSKKDRQKQIEEVLQYAALRDLNSNPTRVVVRKQKKKFIEKDPTTGVEREVEREVDVENIVERELPFGVTLDAVKIKMDEIGAKLTGAQKEAYQSIRKELDAAWDSMADRGLVDRMSKLPDYFPHKILDWTEADHPGMGMMLPKKQPFRGYLKGRKGSKRMFDISLRALQDYLLKVDVNNAKHDFINDTSEAIHARVMKERDLTRMDDVDWTTMPTKEWTAFQKEMDADGYVLFDTRYGRSGKETLERDADIQKLLSDIFAGLGVPVTPEVVVGRSYRPNVEKGIYFVTKEYAEFLRVSQQPAWRVPGMEKANKLIGKWIKGPMLRGFGGLAGPARAARNMAGDLHGLYLKGERGLPDVYVTMANFPAAKRIIHAWRAKTLDPDYVSKLTPFEESLLQELEARGTLQINVRGQETKVKGRLVEEGGDVAGDEWLAKVMPETSGTIRRFLSKMYRADFKWARALDDYSENLVRVSYFMRERMERFQTLTEEGVPEAEANSISADYAHLKTGEVLVNYNHLTPLERHALNGIVFPFYTWAKSNFTGIMAAIAEHPLQTTWRAGIAAAPFAILNALFFKDEEERLWNKNPWLAAKPHLILGWARDAFGNPLVLSWDSTMGEALSFLGMDQFDSDLFQFLTGHGGAEIFAKDLVPGVFENMKNQWQSFMAPWLRWAGTKAFGSQFVSPSEAAEGIVEINLAQLSRPWSDLQAALNLSHKERSVEQRWIKNAPFLGFPDLIGGITGEALPMHYQAGRLQRRESQLSNAIGDNMQTFMSGLLGQDPAPMQAALDRVWDEMGDELSEAGVEPFHLLSRFIDRAIRQIKGEALLQAGITPKWLQLSISQKAEIIMRMMEER